MSGLTMQEVIEHCEKTAKRIEDNVEFCREWLEAEPISLHSKRYMEHKQTAEWLKELQRYKDLEEAGRLIELPCKVGATLYRVVNGEVYEYMVDDLNIERYDIYPGIVHVYDEAEFFGRINSNQIGKEFFLTKAEAEAKLAELKGGAE